MATPDPDKTTNWRDPHATRERILDAALLTFSRQGYHGTRLDDIVDASETSKGAIYFHFANKERLFLALVDQFADLLERRVLEAIETQGRGMARVRVALETVLETFGRYRRPAKILLVQAVGLGNVFENKRAAVTDRFARLIEGYLREAIEVGDQVGGEADIAGVDEVGAGAAVEGGEAGDVGGGELVERFAGCEDIAERGPLALAATDELVLCPQAHGVTRCGRRLAGRGGRGSGRSGCIAGRGVWRRRGR